MKGQNRVLNDSRVCHVARRGLSREMNTPSSSSMLPGYERISDEEHRR